MKVFWRKQDINSERIEITRIQGDMGEIDGSIIKYLNIEMTTKKIGARVSIEFEDRPPILLNVEYLAFVEEKAQGLRKS